MNSIKFPIQTFENNVNNLISILEFVRKNKKIKIFYASSSEIFKNKKKKYF